MKSSEQEDFKTDLTFWIWWRFEVVIAKKLKRRNSKSHPLIRLCTVLPWTHCKGNSTYLSVTDWLTDRLTAIATENQKTI